MLKLFAAYTTPAFTAGVEAFVNNLAGDTHATFIKGGADTINTKAAGISLYIHGNIIKNRLRFFARVDSYNPNKNVDNSQYSGYTALSSPNGYNSPGYRLTFSSSTGAPTSATSTGDITAKETFFTAGLDFVLQKNLHFLPNVWYTHYASQLATGAYGDHDLTYRATFYLLFGKP
jgi:hypothetical protein